MWREVAVDALEAVQAAIDRLGIAESSGPIIVAVSGGADSTCLLDCLNRLGLPLVVAHFDHGLRPRSWEDARHVLRLAAQLRLPAVAARAERGALRARGGSLENAARLARYAFLGDCAQQSHSRIVALGHTQDDQAETVLLHLVRGAGASGLRGMLPEVGLQAITGRTQDAGVRVIRPLLKVPRATTTDWCEVRGFALRQDPTNSDTTILRNRIRMELLPMLATYNPAIRDALGRTADLLAAEADANQAMEQAFVPAMLRSLGEGQLALDSDDLRLLPVGMQRLIIRHALVRLAEGSEIGFETVERARAAVTERAHRSLAGDLEVRTQGGLSVFAKRDVGQAAVIAHPQFNASDPMALQVPGRCALSNGWSIEGRFERAGHADHQLHPDSEREILVDAEACGPDFQVDVARPGDRMTPFGAPGGKKVSDLLQQARVPLAARARWPVLRQAGTIVWLVGIRRAEGARVGARTRKLLRLRLLAPGEGEEDPDRTQREGSDV